MNHLTQDLYEAAHAFCIENVLRLASCDPINDFPKRKQSPEFELAADRLAKAVDRYVEREALAQQYRNGMFAAAIHQAHE